MIHDYYILAGKNRSGPYDLVAVVRKIRNGTMTAQTLLQIGETAEPKPAQEWAELSEFFGDKKDDRPAHADRSSAQNHGLGSSLQNGLRFLQRNQYTTVFSGMFVLGIILATTGINFGILPPSLHVFAYLACFILGHFMLSCYMLSVLRMARGQPVDAAYLQSKISPAAKSLLISSLFISLPAIVGLALLTSTLPELVLLIGLFIFALPGLFTLALYAYTPLLIMDKGYDFWEAMEASRKAVLKGGLENAGVIYALFVINFLAVLCVLLPLAITLPITMGAIAEMYDETFG